MKFFQPTLLSVAVLALTATSVVGQKPTPTDRNLIIEQAARQAVNQQRRVALVIGNAAYKEAPLLNPVNDARAIAAALRESGFTVIVRENADQRSMSAAMREFGDKLGGGGTGLFYYAGHGMQIKGRNFLIPVGANVEREDEVAYSAIDAQAVLDKMEAAGNGMNIMILDACRNNPFTRSTRSGQAGLAQMDAPVGTLVAFATSPGNVASDGAGANGLYTQHLLQAMQTQGAKVEDVFKQVRANVRKDSQGKQIPWEATSLEGDFYFKGGKTVVNVAAVQSASPVTAPAPLASPSTSVASASSAVRPSNPAPAVSLAPAPPPLTAANPVVVAAAPRPPARMPAGDSSLQEEVDRRTQELLQQLEKAPASAVIRPAAQQNSFGYTVGDRWRYQNVDKFKQEVVSNWSRVVDGFNTDGTIRLNGGSSKWAANGSVVSFPSTGGTTRVNQIGYSWIPTQLRVGHTQPYQDVGTRLNSERQEVGRWDIKGEFKVVARENVRVPAGEFDSWRVEFRGFAGRNNIKEVFWYVPALRNFVATELEARDSSGALNEFTRNELTSYSVRGATEALAKR